MRIGLVLLTSAVLVGCSSAPLVDTPLVTPQGGSGCSPQLLAVSEVPAGTLEVRVVDSSGAPQAGVTVMAYRDVYTGAKCSSSIKDTTDAQGMIKFERLKTGPFVVQIPGGGSERVQVEVKPNETAAVTLIAVGNP